MVVVVVLHHSQGGIVVVVVVVYSVVDLRQINDPSVQKETA